MGLIYINKISLKLGSLFLFTILAIEMLLFIFLYYGLLENRIDDEKDSLLARGNSHRDVLEKHYDKETLEHVAMMESEAETIVAITDKKKNLLVHSDSLQPVMVDIMTSDHARTFEAQIIEDHWKDEPYIATVSPIFIDHELKGYVYMFLDTESIRTVNRRLTLQFLFIGGLTIIITAITVFFLSRFIANPLIRMKRTTERIARGGKGTEMLDIKRKDELGDLARSIASLSDELQQVKKERTDFLASIAHELRTPLTYLKGYADFATRTTTDEQKRQHYLQILKEESERLAILVSGLFELAKIDQNTFTIEKRRVDLVALVDEIIGRIKPAFEEKGVRLVVDHATVENSTIDMDEERMKQVLINLLDNALHYTEPGKTVQVKVDEDKSDLILSVEDEGEGIPSEQIQFIWDRLYRVDKSRSRKHGGAGIGLSITKEIIERHGGTVEVKSTLGKGTVIIVRLKREEGTREENSYCR